MNKDDSTTEDLLQEYNLKISEVKKLGLKRKICNEITSLFRLLSNNSAQKAQKIENKILEKINDPAIICKVLLDEDNNVEITFESKTADQTVVKDIHLYKALHVARENTKENQDINVFSKETSGCRYPIFLLKEEMNSHNSMNDILSYLLPDRQKSISRKHIINFLRGRQAARQLAHSYKKEDLQQHKFASEKRSNILTTLLKLNSFVLIISGICFVGYPGLLESSSIMSRFFDSSVNYKTCKTIGKDGKDTNKTDKSCKNNQNYYKLVILIVFFLELNLANKNYQAKANVLVVNYALDILSGELKKPDILQQ
jgi:hypothetical protein